MGSHLASLVVLCSSRLNEVCDCSFLYWHRVSGGMRQNKIASLSVCVWFKRIFFVLSQDVVVPLYFADIYQFPAEAHRLHVSVETELMESISTSMRSWRVDESAHDDGEECRCCCFTCTLSDFFLPGF